MTPESIIAQLERSGISLYLDADENLRYRAKPGVMTDETRAMINLHKAGIVSWLQDALQARFDASEWVGTPEGRKKALDAYHVARNACLAVWDRPLTDDELASVAQAYESIRNQHTQALKTAGWKGLVFDGLNPTTCKSVGDIPGIIAAYMAGGSIVSVHPDRIDLIAADGTCFSKVKGSVMIAGQELIKYLETKSDTT